MEKLRFGELVHGKVVDRFVGCYLRGVGGVVGCRWDHAMDCAGVGECQWDFLWFCFYVSKGLDKVV